ncbi:unnamed protein product [Closterium sp. NIES-64]|nr:unnamed protein product [Closterium sp. NIES-65]CAI5999537.1 unnamed protein product [Closterium sp. NIES-64]
MCRECKLDAESFEEGNNATRTQPVQATTVHTLLGRIKACQMASRVEATLYREKELGIMREISVVRSEVRFMVRTEDERDLKWLCGQELRRPALRHHRRYLHHRTVPPDHDEGVADMGDVGVEPVGNHSFADDVEISPHQGATLLSDHTLLRGASIREITLPDIFFY